MNVNHQNLIFFKVFFIEPMSLSFNFFCSINTGCLNFDFLIVNAPHFISFTLIFIFVQQVEAGEEEYREEYHKLLLKYRALRFLHRYKVILMSLLMWASNGRMNTF